MAEKTTTTKKKPTSKAPANAAAAKKTTDKVTAPKDTKKADKVVAGSVPKKQRSGKWKRVVPVVAQTAFWITWTIIGLVMIVGTALAFINDETLTETLRVTPSSSTSASATTQTPTAPAGPSEEQLDCVEQEVGEARFQELLQGLPPTEDETATIDSCFTS